MLASQTLKQMKQILLIDRASNLHYSVNILCALRSAGYLVDVSNKKDDFLLINHSEKKAITVQHCQTDYFISSNVSDYKHILNTIK